MKIRIADFKGEIPRRADRLLGGNVAMVSSNARLDDGNVTPFRESALIETLQSAASTIYLHNDTWLSFAAQADIATGPVAQDRLYYTTLTGAPRVIANDADYPLALAAPANAPTAAMVGTLDTELAESFVYAYTFVTEFDEESAPSPASDAILWSPGNTVSLSDMDAAPTGRGIDRRRIYRSQTSASGITDLYFVAEIPVANTTYTHDLEANPLQEVLPSADFDPPVDTLDGLTAMSNGMMAGFSGREVFFCEPYIPHAWPQKYSLTVDHDIVALSAFGSTLAVLTTATPYIIQGTAPENMIMQRMEANLPCVSRRGVVDLGYAAAYPSADGLIVISASGTQLASRNLFTRDDWRELSPSTMFAASYDGRYAFGYSDGAIDSLNGGEAVLDPANPDSYNGGGPSSSLLGFVNYDGGSPLTKAAINAIGFIDLTGEQPYFLRTDPEFAGSPDAFFLNPADGNLYFLSNTTEVRQFDNRSRPTTTYRWRSKAFYTPSPVSFAAIMVEADTTPAQTVLTTRIFADGKLVHQTDKFNTPQRLPSGFRSKEWQIEIEGSAEVTSISIGQTLEELAVA
jgi:hypothetical protein